MTDQDARFRAFIVALRRALKILLAAIEDSYSDYFRL